MSSNDDNVVWLACPQNNMRLTLDELRQRIDRGEVRSIAIACEIGTDHDTQLYSGYVLDDDAELFRLSGLLFSLMRRIDHECENRYLTSEEQCDE